MPFKYNSSLALYALLLASATSLLFGAISWARTTGLYLPLPTWIPVTTTFLAPVALLVLASFRIIFNESNTNLARLILPLSSQIHTILLTTLGTLALSYLFPSQILSCHLESRWQSFYQQKNAHAIRTIQDRFQCCGLRSIHDRAWPFKDRAHGDNACELQMGYRGACIEPWGDSQRGVSWMVFAAVVGGLLVKGELDEYAFSGEWAESAAALGTGVGGG
ncbi:uncharacterized protein BDW70DRAFT_160498 [Aspergillus foveolatus]|uniref:uncharacterized protein n=1 Tax=Aspergillus foveolatus TaxID=210207 RepID=UPI003CCD402F